MKWFGYVLALYSISASSGYPVNSTLRKITYSVPSGTAALVQIGAKSYLISNWHVCRNFKDTTVSAKNEFYGETVEVKVLGVFPELDTCVMSGTGRPGAKLGKTPALNMPVYSAGYPGGVKTLVLTQGFTRSFTRASLDFGASDRCPASFARSKLKCERSFQLYDTTMVGAPGCSGSAMLNSRGEYVGLINSTNQGTLSALNVQNVIVAVRLLKP